MSPSNQARGNIQDASTHAGDDLQSTIDPIILLIGWIPRSRSISTSGRTKGRIAAALGKMPLSRTERESMEPSRGFLRKFQSRARSFGKRFNFSTAIFILILFVGVFARIWGFNNVPPGLNQDEASIGVEADDLYHYSVDRNGNSFPVNFVSWGEGMDSLYGYMLLPFMPIGLTPFTERLPALLTGILTLPLIYFIAKRVYGNHFGLLSMFLLAISPWHIIMSRWGLNENVVPFVATLGFAALLASAKNNLWFIASAFCLGLCFYAYGAAYIAVPILLMLATVILWVSKSLSLKSGIIGLSVFAITITPIVLFVLVNDLGWPTIHLWSITIPRLPVRPRFESMAAIFNGHPLHAVKENVIAMFTLLWTQTDGLIWNSLSPYGYFYLVTFPLAVLGAIFLIPVRNPTQSPERWLLLAWLGASLTIGVVQSVNVNRINMIFVPLLICFAAFLEWVGKRSKLLVGIALLGLLIAFGLFMRDYLGNKYRTQADAAFFPGLIPALEYAEQVKNVPICVTDHVNMPYIYVLFTDHLDPKDYLNTIQYTDPHTPFRPVASLGRYTFGLSNCPPVAAGTIYILNPQETQDLSGDLQKKTFGDYVVAIPAQDRTNQLRLP
jgi:hypothetical protein